MKLTDIIPIVLSKYKVAHAFGLQGGAVVHIFDSIEKAGIHVTYTHHEESAALAAVANAKVTGTLGCAIVTTGPGSTNAITGLLAAWQDSIPCIFISGQVRSNHTSYGRKVRQVGTQEVNICDIVRPITKYTKFIDNKDKFLSYLEKAISIAFEGRPGPVWIDIPLDIHWSDIKLDTNTLKNYGHQKSKNISLDHDSSIKSLELVKKSERPLLVLGYGVRSSGALNTIKKLVQKNKIPFVTTWTASDFFPTDHPLNFGIIGMSGQRGANSAIFKSDLLICLGTHLSIPHTTTLFDTYAPDSKKIIVNIDKNQLENLNVSFDIKVLGDVKDYITWLYKQKFPSQNWYGECDFKDQNWYVPKGSIFPNSNIFIHNLTKSIKQKKCLIVDGGGTALYAGFQSSVLNDSDRIICSSSMSSMGTGLAETVGVSRSNLFEKYICVIGDGSLMMNIQDLQTIRQLNVNVIICVINNNGYLAIRHTQQEFLEGKLYGTHPDWSLTMPSFEKVASAFDISYIKCDKPKDIEIVIEKLKLLNGPIVCEVVVDEHQNVLFKQNYKNNADGTFSPQPLSEMASFDS